LPINPFEVLEVWLETHDLIGVTAGALTNVLIHLQGPLRPCLLLDESSFLAGSLGLKEDLREPFFADPTALDSLLQDDEDDWSGSYQPSAVEEAHFVRAPSISLSSSPLDSFYCNVSDLQTSSPEQPGRSDHVSFSCLGKGDQSSSSDQMSPEDGFFRLLPLRYQELKEENSKLRRTLSQTQAVAESQAERCVQRKTNL
uniref:Endosome-associated-trafficking regulator 1 n=1 Tax=Pseudonaja textilis TaxID=8673 RepID=A0A670YQ86_PSETE